MEGIATVVGFVGMAFILAMIILNEVWNIRFDRTRDQIREIDRMRDQIRELSNQVDRLEREQGRMKGSIEGMRKGGLTGIEPGGRFRG